MKNSVLLSHAVKATLTIGSAGSLIGAGAALAQTDAASSGTSAQSTHLSRIEVTGSHIPRTSIATAQPVIRVSRQQIAASGFSTVGKLLQNLSTAGTALNERFIGEGNSGRSAGNGSTEIDIHNLGAKRTLVLVNGRRWVPQNIGGVDLSTIPTSIIDHIEILLNGASAIYGSDAISGVVNIITVKNYNGAEANAYMGIYDARGDGGGFDGKTQRYSFTVGTSNNKSSVLLSAGYYNQNPVYQGNRTLSKEPVFGTGTTFGSSGTPGGRFITTGPSTGGYNCGAPDPQSNYTCDLSGPLTSSSSGHPFTSRDRYNFSPVNSLVTPTERWWIYSQTHYDLTDNVTFDATALYNRRDALINNAAAPIFYGATGGLFANGLPVGVSANNPYNPFHADLVPATSFNSPIYKRWCSEYGSGPNGTCTSNADLLILLGRRPVELGVRAFNHQVATFRFESGFSGYFTLAGNQWQWDTHYVFAEANDTEIVNGHINNARAQRALSGLCLKTPNCVPLNLFGGPGTITPSMANYVGFTDHNLVNSRAINYTANLAGNFLNSWYAGPWGVAVGYEYLENNGFYQPDSINVEGNSDGVAAKPSKGRIATNAEYAELNVPLAKNVFLAKSLDVDVAERYSQFHVVGKIGGTGPQVGKYTHAATPRVTLKWRPIRQLLLRAAWSEAFRVPSVSELFVGPTENDETLTDPCLNHPSRPNCPSNVTQQLNPQIRVYQGGNPNLNPEKSVSRSFGFVWSPQFVAGLDLSADYYKVELVQAVGKLGGQNILNGCNISNIPAYCSLITRQSGQLVSMQDPNINAGSLKATGIDVNIDYKFPVTPIGEFRLHATATYNRQYTVCNSAFTTSGSGFNCQNRAGSVVPNDAFGVIPKNRYNMSFNWNLGPWSAVWNITIIGRMYQQCTNSSLSSLGPPSTWGWCSNVDLNHPSNSINELGTSVYHDVQASYNISAWNTTVTLGIQNLFDKLPPVRGFLSSYYRIPGRFFYGRVAVRF